MKPRYAASLAGIAVLLGLGGMLVHPVAAEQRFSDWSLPVNLGPPVNSAFNDLAPHSSKDGLSLYFSSTRPEGAFAGIPQLFMASNRHGGLDSWSEPANLGPLVNTGFTELFPSLSSAGRRCLSPRVAQTASAGLIHG